MTSAVAAVCAECCWLRGGGGGSLWLAEAGRGAASVADGALRDPRVSGTLADP